MVAPYYGFTTQPPPHPAKLSRLAGRRLTQVDAYCENGRLGLFRGRLFLLSEQIVQLVVLGGEDVLHPAMKLLAAAFVAAE